jgi:hypothetical protein
MHRALLCAGLAEPDLSQHAKEIELFSSNAGREKRSLVESGEHGCGRHVIIWKEGMALISKPFRNGQRSACGIPRGAEAFYAELQ